MKGSLVTRFQRLIATLVTGFQRLIATLVTGFQRLIATLVTRFQRLIATLVTAHRYLNRSLVTMMLFHALRLSGIGGKMPAGYMKTAARKKRAAFPCADKTVI